MENATPLSIPPNGSGALSYGWERMKSHFLYLFLIVLVLVVIDSPLQGLKDRDGSYTSSLDVLIEALALAYWLLFVPVIDYSADLLFVKAVRREKIDIKEIIIGFKNYLNIILANLLVTALIGMALIALIIPGIIVACRLAFVSYLVMDQQLDPITAVEKSWRMTRGYGWEIFLLGFLSILIFIVGLALVIVGVFPAIIWIKASFAALYQAVLDRSENEYAIQGNPEPVS